MASDRGGATDPGHRPERRVLFGSGRYARLRASIGRHPADVIRMGVATGVVFACLFIAAAQGINAVEAAIFEEVQRLPAASAGFWRLIIWAGSWPGIVALAGSAAYVGRIRIAVSFTVASLTAWLLAVILRWLTAPRPRPVGV